jgi:hypothetical protein
MALSCNIWSNHHHICYDTYAHHDLVYAKEGMQSRRSRSKGLVMKSQLEDTMKEPSANLQNS